MYLLVLISDLIVAHATYFFSRDRIQSRDALLSSKYLLVLGRFHVIHKEYYLYLKHY